MWHSAKELTVRDKPCPQSRAADEDYQQVDDSRKGNEEDFAPDLSLVGGDSVG